MEHNLVSIMNRRSGMVLEQSEDGSIQAREANLDDRRQQWHRIPVDGGLFAYQNCETLCVLDHWHAVEGAGNVVARNDDIHNPNHQWREDTIEDAFIALNNRVSGRYLDHYWEREIQVTGGDAANIFQQWSLIWHPQDGNEANEIVAFQNLRSGMVLEHNRNVRALSNSVNAATHQWRRQAIEGSGYVTYTNIASGMLLSHTRQGIVALRGDAINGEHQWRELDLGDGLVVLKNRASGRMLDHYNNNSIRAPDIRMDPGKLWQIHVIPPAAVNTLRVVNPPAEEIENPLWLIQRQDVTYLTEMPMERGGFGEVYHVKWIYCEAAVKEIRITTEREMNSFRMEVNLWSRLQHGNIVRLYGANDRERPYFIVSAYAENGRLNEYLRRQRADGHEVVWKKLLQVAAGLQYIHQRGIIHGDLKGDNIVVDAAGTAMLVDFGLSFFHEGAPSIRMSVENNLRAMQWRAPEYVTRTVTRPTFKSDIYSLGMTIIEAVTDDTPPWGHDYTHDGICDRIRERNIEVPRPSLDVMTNAQWELVQQMIAYEQEYRPNLEYILERLEQFATEETDPF
ncbi:hypothetical protein PRIC1_013965 [Phytophthora ramorum]